MVAPMPGSVSRPNAASAGLAPLTADQQAAVRDVYDRIVRPHVHARW